MKKGETMSMNQRIKISEAHKSLGSLHWAKRPDVKKKMSKTWFVKGQKAWNKGLPAPWSTGGFTKGQVAWNKGKKGLADDKHPMWKGKKVGLAGLHVWVRRKLGVPEKCTKCGIKASGRKLHLANRSGKYKRDLEDWVYLCVKCHWAFDRKRRLAKLKKRVKARRERKKKLYTVISEKV